MNRRIKRHCLEPSCVIIIGDRGTGKSTLFALMADEALRLGRTVYCQYPYDGVHIIPSVPVSSKGVTRFELDKDWLYSNKFEPYSLILIDEARTVWAAREYGKWTKSDDEFFNFIRKEHITIALATQQYDGLDLNVKRAADETWYLSLGFFLFPNLTHIEASHTTTVKVADRNTEVIGRAFKSGVRKVAFDICEVPIAHYRFNRKKYYGKFITDFTPNKKSPIPQPLWNDFIDFTNDVQNNIKQKDGDVAKK